MTVTEVGAGQKKIIYGTFQKSHSYLTWDNEFHLITNDSALSLDART